MNSIKKYKNIHIISKLLGCFCLFLIQSSVAQIAFYEEPIPLKSINTVKNEDFLALDRLNGRVLFTQDNGLNKEGNKKSKIFAIVNDSVELLHEGDDYYTPAGVVSNDKNLIFHTTHFERGRYYGSLQSQSFDKDDMEIIRIPYFDNLAPVQSGQISVDGKFILVSAQKKNGYGVEDIYVSRFENGTWTALDNLGFSINTRFQEISPFLADDNKTLIFASNRTGGQGSFDLYISQRLDDSWRNWSTPLNLGTKVNTSGAETSMVFFADDSFAYYTSTTDSDGYGDIKKIKIKADIEAVLVDSVSTRNNSITKKSVLTFRLTDAKAKKNIQGLAYYTMAKDTIFLDAQDDVLIMEKPAEGKSFKLEFKSTGYLSGNETVMLSAFDEEFRVIEVGLEPLSKGNVITLNNVLFYRGTANFIEGSQSELDLVVEMLTENPSVEIFLKGHTDNVGNAQLNTRLSEQRVLAVEEYLFQKGIQKSRINGQGFGGSQPKFSNDEEETRKLNRRVEFEIIKD